MDGRASSVAAVSARAADAKAILKCCIIISLMHVPTKSSSGAISAGRSRGSRGDKVILTAKITSGLKEQVDIIDDQATTAAGGATTTVTTISALRAVFTPRA